VAPTLSGFCLGRGRVLRWPIPGQGLAGVAWQQLTPGHWFGTWDSKIGGTVTRDGDGWLAYLRLEDPPGLSPITTVGHYATVEAAQVATDEVWAARSPHT
jgi:hypothetical protein